MWPDDTAATCSGKVRTPRDGGAMGTVPSPKRCGLYLPGHEVHWIQGIHSGDPGEVAPVPCRILEVRDDGTVTILITNQLLELWTHDPIRLRALVAQRGVDATYQERWRLLRVPSKRASFCIDVTPASNPDRRPCPTSQPYSDTLVEQLLATGGFSVRVQDVASAVERMGNSGEGE